MSDIRLYTAEWCAGCKQLKPELERIEDAEYKICDADDDDVKAEMLAFGIRALPALVKVEFDRRKGCEVVKGCIIGNRHSRETFEKFFKES